jgi:hypothetical protein
MDPRRFRTYRIIAFDVLLILFCISNIPTVVDRARLPVTTDLRSSATVITSVDAVPSAALLRSGDILVAWNEIRVSRPEHVEFLGDRSTIGETVHLTVDRDGNLLTLPASLVAFTSSIRFALVYAVTGVVVFLLALFLVLKRPEDPVALSLHRSLAAVGALILLTQGAIDPGDPMSYLRR